MSPKTKARKNRPGRPSRKVEQDLRAEILNSAIELFSEHGFAKVKLKDITDRAQASIGLVRHYFGSKEELIIEANARVVEDLRAAFKDIEENLEVDHDFFEHLQERIVNLLTPRLYLLLYLKHLSLERPEEARPVFKAYFQMFQTHFNRLEARGLLRVDVNKVWLTFMVMFIQLGPVFLAEQIENIIGRPAYDPEVLKERGREIANLFKATLRQP